MTHNHVWQVAAATSKEELMALMAEAGEAGRWLKGGELAWAGELASEGKIRLCCKDTAGTYHVMPSGRKE